MNCAWKELLGVLPPWLGKQVDRQGSGALQEIRLRQDRPPMLHTQQGRMVLEGKAQQQDLNYVLNMACRYSPWTVPTVQQGFITIAGGHRIGICGEARMRNGKICGIATVTSLNIRICQDFPGCSRNLRLRQGSILLIGPPGSGKTTLLRDLIRGRSALETVAVVDERGEIFPPAARFESGENTDVITGCTKKQGIERVLRVMAPQTIAVDEVTGEDDCAALIHAGRCGVSLLATLHATGVEDLYNRPIYQRLLQSRLFEQAVVLQMDKSWRTERIIV